MPAQPIAALITLRWRRARSPMPPATSTSSVNPLPSESSPVVSKPEVIRAIWSAGRAFYHNLR